MELSYEIPREDSDCDSAYTIDNGLLLEMICSLIILFIY